jgi:predicted RNase H-like nuclease (RuvC/YqgF family)
MNENVKLNMEYIEVLKNEIKSLKRTNSEKDDRIRDLLYRLESLTNYCDLNFNVRL